MYFADRFSHVGGRNVSEGNVGGRSVGRSPFSGTKIAKYLAECSSHSAKAPQPWRGE